MSFYVQLGFFEVYQDNVDGVIKIYAEDLGRNKNVSRTLFERYYRDKMADGGASGQSRNVTKSKNAYIDDHEIFNENDKQYLQYIKKFYER